MFNSLKKTIKQNKIVATAGALALTAQSASAAIVAPEFAATDAVTVGTAVITGLALIWAIKKAMSMAR